MGLHTFPFTRVGIESITFRTPVWDDWDRLIRAQADSGDERLARNLIQAIGKDTIHLTDARGPIKDDEPLPFNSKQWIAIRGVVSRMMSPDAKGQKQGTAADKALATIDRALVSTFTAPSGKRFEFKVPTAAEYELAHKGAVEFEVAMLNLARRGLVAIDGVASPGGTMWHPAMSLTDGRVYVDVFVRETSATGEDVDEIFAAESYKEG